MAGVQRHEAVTVEIAYVVLPRRMRKHDRRVDQGQRSQSRSCLGKLILEEVYSIPLKDLRRTGEWRERLVLVRGRLGGQAATR